MAVETAGRVATRHRHYPTLVVAPTVSRADYQYRLRNNRLGLWLFILSDSFVFGGLLVTRFYLLGGHRPHLDQVLGLIVTSVLLASSFFMNRAETLISNGDRRGFLSSTLITMLLGIAFLVGVIGFEWRLAPFGPGDGAQGAVFYMMTGMHAFHVLSGVAFLGIVYRNGRKGCYSAERHWAVEACANYWHFVDVVWIFFYPALYLIGTVAG
ncbi:MAG: cytochrome c oxidase subunit 3 [Ardenticatenaceae bacterium]|nr:cytochrome c oxidase subunit 3 [Ardenticatenaceae bacterium]HBY92390.1 heme-copper oxidase subunit III [Chloroflexota bacterium]